MESGLLSVWFLKECTSKNIMHYYACHSIVFGCLYHVLTLVVLFNAIIMGPSALYMIMIMILISTSPRHVQRESSRLLTKQFIHSLTLVDTVRPPRIPVTKNSRLLLQDLDSSH